MIKVIGLALVLVLVFLVTPGLVEEAGKSNPKRKITQTRNTDGSTTSKAGLAASKIGIDPDGAVRPITPAEERKLNAEFLKTLSHYQRHQPKQRADGSLSLVIAPYSLNASVAHRTADGKIEVGCTQNLKTPARRIQKAAQNNSEQLPEE